MINRKFAVSYLECTLLRLMEVANILRFIRWGPSLNFINYFNYLKVILRAGVRWQSYSVSQFGEGQIENDLLEKGEWVIEKETVYLYRREQNKNITPNIPVPRYPSHACEIEPCPWYQHALQVTCRRIKRYYNHSHLLYFMKSVLLF